MDSHKEYIKRLVSSRKNLTSKLEDLLGEDISLKLYYYKLDDLDIDVIAKNETILVIANENFKNAFERVDYETTFNAKGEAYKVDFKSAYEQCKAAVKSNGNLSLNSSVVGVIGPIYDPLRRSNGYAIYNELRFNVIDLYRLDKEYFNKLKDYTSEDISMNALVRLIYDMEYSSPVKPNISEKTEDDDIETESKDEDQLVYSRNKILFGPPGTGKSYNIKSKMNLIMEWQPFFRQKST